MCTEFKKPLPLVVVFAIKYTNYKVDIGEVKRTVKKELQGPAKLLGYRVMQQKVRELHRQNVLHNLVNLLWGKLTQKELKQGGVRQSNPSWQTNAFVTGVSK